MIVTVTTSYYQLMKRLSQKETLPWMTFEEVVAIHDTILQEYGGLKGIRDEGLLRALGNSPRSRCYDMSYDGGHLNIYDFASDCMYDIAKGHPFNDGNKRTAVAVALEFINQCGVIAEFDTVLLEQLVKRCSNSSYSQELYTRNHIREEFIACLK